MLETGDWGPRAKQYELTEFEKKEYEVKDMATGKKLGSFGIIEEAGLQEEGADGSVTVWFWGDATEGDFEDDFDIQYNLKNWGRYKYKEQKLQVVRLGKKKSKTLEYYYGIINERLVVLVYDVDEGDIHPYYQTEADTRYLLCVMYRDDYEWILMNKNSDLYIIFTVINYAEKESIHFLTNNKTYMAILE